ncbi:LOW QUALITY PROTEIN: hypothetical protein PHMEG_0002044 [Phytophthora megakarya]|uniref:Uncharacterized protein n=1 Tax=Phytophthora megakarya TaxID=4795 RepID=A0A225X0A3_9STRA|nr:LOW QUALITY PROTEIN: hypothetical protein PHMEG_0002044 [Phytophthora megakarya]
MELRSLDEHELDILRHNYTKHPKLALLYFHCCSLDPDTYVANDENLNGPGSDDVVNRLKLSLDEPVGIDNIRRCQEKVSRSCLDNGDVWACASCCEILNSVEDNIKFEEIGSLHQNFRLTAKEVHELGDIPETVIAQHLQVYRTEDGFWYYLNPDLVPDTHHVVLCALCAADPKKVPFSIASGHDYGRSGDLPDLNDVAAKCISPVRSFGLSIVASGKHSIGHSICFPSTGPSACSKVLPCSDMDCVPKVTFIEPREEWRVKKESYRNLYDLPVDSMYSWLSVLMNTHAFFKSAGIVVDTSEGAKEALRTLESTIHNLVDTVCSVEATTIDEAVVSERFGAEYADGNPADPVLTKSAVLKTVDGLDSSITNAAVEAMIDMIQPLEPQTIPIQRGADPFAEWSENGEMIAGAFPCLFIRGGKMLPHGTWPPTFIRHLMLYYDGRFEKNTMLVATLFNQLQRHTVVQQAARIGTSKAAVLEKLGNLANSKQFKLALINAKLDPSSSQAKRLNGYLLRILSLMGTSVPFSPFERAATRPKLAAVRARFGIAQHWVTVAPPEHHNLELHRIAMIRQRRSWNQSDELYRSKACWFEDLPYSIRSNARGMLNVSNTYPALAARVFDRCVRRIHDDIVLCKDTSNTRLSIDYGQRQAGAYGTVAAHAGVIEPQLDGRLHIHMNLYGSKYSPELLSRVVCSPPLRDRAAEWLNSVCCTKLDRDIHEWREKNLQCDRSLPKAFEIRLPETVTDVVSFEKAAQKRAATTNFHSHSSTCYKGKRGKYMCRLARPSGVNLHPTCPLLVTRDRSGDMKAGVPPIVHGFPVPQHLLRSIDCGYSVEKGEAFRPHGEGPLVWELQRPASDAYMVETNLILAALTCSHTNSSVINGVDCGDMIDEYQQAYMTKDDVALKSAASALHSALEHNVKFPSHADNSQTPLRIGQYLATRTVNSFSGGHEWSHSLMVHAITGHRSFLSSDKFWYIFPYSLMQYVNDLLSRPNSQRANACTVIPSKDVEEQLEDLADLTTKSVQNRRVVQDVELEVSLQMERLNRISTAEIIFPISRRLSSSWMFNPRNKPT